MGAGALERERRAEVARLLDDGGVARVDQRARHEVEGLLGTARDHDVIGSAADTATDQEFCDLGAQRGPAEGVAVVCHGRQVASDRLAVRAAELCNGQTLDVDLAAREVEARGAGRGFVGPAWRDRDAAGALGEQPVPRELAARGRRRPRICGRRRGAARHERPLADVGPQNAVIDEPLIGLGHGVAAELQDRGELASRGEALALWEPICGHQNAQIVGELEIEGFPSLPVGLEGELEHGFNLLDPI